jgi:outer membrane protein TolC
MRALAAALFASAALARPAAAQGVPDSPPELPKPPPVDDPLLAPPPPAPRVVRSWDEAITLVRQAAPSYASNLQDVLRAEAQGRVALVQLLPTVTGQATYTHQFLTTTFAFAGATFESPAPNVLGLAATLVVPVVNPRGIYAQHTASEGVAAAKLTFSDARRQIAVSLVHTLLQTLAAERAAELNRVGLRTALERLELAKTKVQWKQGTTLDVERAEQDAAAARSMLITGDESLRQTREALGVALGSPVPTSGPSDLSLDAFEQAVARTCTLSPDLESRPDVAAARKRIEIASRLVKDAWYQLLPTLSVQSQVAYTSEAVLAPDTTWLVEGILNVPIYDGGLAAATARDARAAVEQSRQALATTRLNALVNVAQTTRAVTVLAATRDVAKTQRDLARSIDQRTREGYLHGLGTSLDLVTSAQSLRQAEISLVLLEFQVSEARANAVLANADCKY